jgi:hypothetical protein
MRLGLGLSLGASATTAQQRASADPDRYMFFATRNLESFETMVVSAAATQYKLAKYVFAHCDWPANRLRLHFSGFACTTSGSASPAQTVLPGDAQDILSVDIRPQATGVFTRARFAGADAVSVPSGSQGVFSDEILLPLDLDAEGQLKVWIKYFNPPGQNQVPVYRVQKHRGERVWGASGPSELDWLNEAPNTACTPALDTGSDVNAQPAFYGPDIMVAKGWTGGAVALVFNDSIAYGRDTYAAGADGRGNLGVLSMWLDAKDQAIVVCRTSRPACLPLRPLGS